MPCYDPPYQDCSSEISQAVERARADFTHNSPVADMLCATLKYLTVTGEIANMFNLMPPMKHNEIARWWEAHQERDRAKEKAEEARRLADEAKRVAAQARATALAKLTPEERKLLGIK